MCNVNHLKINPFYTIILSEVLKILLVIMFHKPGLLYRKNNLKIIERLIM